MEIVTGSTGAVHVTPIDDAVRNSNVGYLSQNVVFTYLQNFEATSYVNNEIRVFSGYGMMQGRMFKIDDGEWDSVNVQNGSQGFKRADLIVARYHMNTQSGFESIALEVIRGTAGNSYVDPDYSTGDINAGDDCDFPLYRVRMNGLNIEGLDRLFTPIADGGRLGVLENKVQSHINTFNALNFRTNLASESTVYPKNGANVRPGVEGTLPASHGGTGQTTLKNAAISLIGATDTNGTVPADEDYYVGSTSGVSGYQRKPLTTLKTWVENKIKALLGMGNGSTLPVSHGGTGKTSVGNNKVLVGNSSGGFNELGIDSAPSSSSNNLITSKGVANALGEAGYGDMMKSTYDPNKDGIIDPSQGGTGKTSLQATRNAMGLGNTTGALPVANGGTGTTDGTLNGVKLGKSGTKYGYYDGSTFKSFRQPTGNAAVGDVLSGKTFANASNDSLTGTMTNRGAWTGTGTPTGNNTAKVTIPAGYHNGSGYVTANGATSYSAGYSAGVASAQSTTWTEKLFATAMSGTIESYQAILGLPYKNVVKIKNVTGDTVTINYKTSSQSKSVSLANNAEMTPPSDAILDPGSPSYWSAGRTKSGDYYSSVTIEVTFQTKVIR